MLHIHSPSLSSRVEAFGTLTESSYGVRPPTSCQPRAVGLVQLSTVPMENTATDRMQDQLPYRSAEPMSKEAMIRVLKARKLSVHGAYIYHLGFPAILLLASAYASDRISRTVFFDTLNLFVQHTGRSSDHPNGIKVHHLSGLGIPTEVAQKLPLINTRCDLYTVAGVFNGLIDMEDLDLLLSADKKGQFLQRYFPGMAAAPAPTLLSSRVLWDGDNLLIRKWTFRSKQFEEQIAPACAQLEKGPDYYTGAHHYLLRLTAATRNGEAVCDLGPFGTEEEMEALFHDIFHVVEPNYQPSLTWRQDLENFRFVEPSRIEDQRKRPDKRDAAYDHTNHRRGGCRLPCNLV